mgnify:CR=1
QFAHAVFFDTGFAHAAALLVWGGSVVQESGKAAARSVVSVCALTLMQVVIIIKQGRDLAASALLGLTVRRVVPERLPPC